MVTLTLALLHRQLLDISRKSLFSPNRGVTLIVALTLTLNPLWGHCQEYKIEKNAILQEHLLSEKRSTFVYYNLTLSESICFADHENKSKSSWHTEKFAKNCLKEKSSGRMRTKRQNRKVCSSLRSISSSPGHWRTSKLPQQGRVLSDRRTDFQTTLSSRSQLESSAWQTGHFQVNNPDTKTRLPTESRHWRASSGRPLEYRKINTKNYWK